VTRASSASLTFNELNRSIWTKQVAQWGQDPHDAPTREDISSIYWVERVLAAGNARDSRQTMTVKPQQKDVTTGLQNASYYILDAVAFSAGEQHVASDFADIRRIVRGKCRIEDVDSVNDGEIHIRSQSGPRPFPDYPVRPKSVFALKGLHTLESPRTESPIHGHSDAISIQQELQHSDRR
jgi:hypothetical protein